MSPETARQNQDAWTEYWSSGSLHSCATSYSENYTGAVLDFWRGVLGRAGSPASVLDLATGNGALAQLVEAHAGPPIRIDAVDAADIAPPWVTPEARGRIRFHPGVKLESLPFDDASFDLVVSQFGLEYAHWPAALDEAARVCSPAGTMAFVLHHQDSVIVQVGRQEIENIDLLAGTDGLLRAGRGVLAWMAAARAALAHGGEQAAMAGARLAYNAAMQRLSEALDGNLAPDLLLETRDGVHKLVARVASGGLSASEAGHALAVLADSLAASRERTSQMLACALDGTQVDGLRSFLARQRGDARVSVVELRQAEGLLGWGVASATGGSSASST